jgi:hypothetical protein
VNRLRRANKQPLQKRKKNAKTKAVLARGWRQQLGLRLSGTLLLTMLQVALLVGQDAASPAAATAAAGGGGSSESFDGERIARVSLHGLQLVALAGLLVCEVVVQQHQLLARSDGGADGGGGGAECYEPLLAAESGSGGDGRGKRWCAALWVCLWFC